MNIVTSEIKRRIKKQQQRLEDLRLQYAQITKEIAIEEALLAQCEEVLKFCDTSSNDVELRPGSDAAKVRKLIEESGKPLHVTEILKGLGKQDTQNHRASLGGTLNSYVKKGMVFTRPAPNTFGLISSGSNNERVGNDEIIEADVVNS